MTTTNRRYFTSIAGFSDDTAYIRVDRTAGVWDGTTVRRDGRARSAALRGIDWVLEYVKAGVWREIDQREVDNILTN